DSNKGDLSLEDDVLEFLDGTNGIDKLLADAKIGIQDQGITTAKLADSAVTNEKIGSDAITSNKILDGEVQAEDLGADGANEGEVPVVQNDGTVVYQNLSADNVDGEDLEAAQGGRIEVTNGAGTVLKNTILDVNEGNLKLQNIGGTLQVSQLENGTANQILVTNAGGNGVTWGNANVLATGTISSNDLDVINGDFSIFKDVQLVIKDGAVTNDTLGDNAVTTDKILDGEVKANDLGADGSDAGKVGVVQSDGTIVYQNLSSDNVEGKDLTAADNSITVTDGTGATLVDANVKVTDGGIDNAKLADDAVTSEKILDGEVNTDDLADNAVTNDKVGDDAITSDKIKDGEVKTDDIADQTVTSDKLGADPTDEGKVGVVQSDGTIVYQNLSSDN